MHRIIKNINLLTRRGAEAKNKIYTMRQNRPKPGENRLKLGVGTLLAFILPIALSSHLLGITPTQPCLGTIPLCRFKLMVERTKAGKPLPVDSVNVIEAKDKVRYQPIHLPPSVGPRSRVAILIVPASSTGPRKAIVTEPLPAKSAAVWNVPVRAAAIGLVFGPHGLDVKKISALIARNPDLLTQLEDFSQQTSTVEGLVEALAEYEQSPPGSRSLNAMLSGFSSQYGVAVPRLDPTAPSSQQASTLLQAVLPSLSAAPPATPEAAVAQSTGLAASVAAMFFGSPVGLAAGGAMLVQDFHTMMFPDTDFHTAFTQPIADQGLVFCSRDQTVKARTRTTYLWLTRVVNSDAPSVKLNQASRLPLGWNSKVEVTCASSGQLRLLPRARDWRLASTNQTAAVPVTVHVNSVDDTLNVDLTHVTLPPGDYKLMAAWDWTPMTVAGNLQIVKFADFKNVKLTPDSQDRLVAGNGPVPVVLTGDDFEFVNKLAVSQPDQLLAKAEELPFRLERDSLGKPTLRTELDTTTLHPGAYLFTLTQLDGSSHDVPVNVLPRAPELSNLPLRVNVGLTHQTVRLQGSGLERILSLESDGIAWSLSPVPPGTRGMAVRSATVELSSRVKPGDRINATMVVAGMAQPLIVKDLLQVAGPRPRITNVQISFPDGQDVALQSGEIPAATNVSFVVRAVNLDSHPEVLLSCANAADTRQPVTLNPGDNQPGLGQLDEAGTGVLFLAINPGAIGQSGCALNATVVTLTAGDSAPYPLGRILRLPRITKFALTERQIGSGVYQGILTGQDLQMIAQTGWSPTNGYPVREIATPVAGSPLLQTLKIGMPWPPPSPHAPVYIWLRGETQGRLTKAHY
jgi:hypothetical protein